MNTDDLTIHDFGGFSLWDLGIESIESHNLETKGLEEVNKMLSKGWIMLHIYTLKYQEQGEWRERPMAILGKPTKTKSIKTEIVQRVAY